MNRSLNRVFPLAALLLASFAAACSNGGAVVGPPPPPVGNFSNASLKGQYAFSMSGSELCGVPAQSSFFTRAGSFTVDGNGNITTGLEDINFCTGVRTLQFTGGKYSISPDGHGTLSLINITGTTNYSLTLSTTTLGVIAQTDVNVTASGSFHRQNAAAFSDSAINRGYVFDFAGISNTGNPESIIGRFDADGAGNISLGLFDSNEAGTPSGQQLFPPGAFYQVDTNGDGTNFGRGTANIAGHDFAFYIVDATRLEFLGTDLQEVFSGEALAQQNIVFTPDLLKSSFAFLIGGSSLSQNVFGPIATAGRFDADGLGNLSGIFLDENNSGFLTLLPSTGGTVTGNYTVDANGLGGGTATWTDTNVGTFSFIFYLISPSQAVFQEAETNPNTGITSDGSFFAQTPGPITSASLAGDFAFVWSGVAVEEEDFVGHLKLTSASGNNATGAMDFNDFGPGQQFFDIPFSGPLTITAPGTGPNTLSVTTTFSTPRTFDFTAYAVDSNRIFLIGSEKNRPSVIAGSLVRQP